ncbi:helix-turn-helix domain-containing protein [Bordetella genomosp. 13]|uniref:helix-turn-helix domain-containing protein n=1 Tax=Bordetella genomosp. 13 TaxID=463040 RepID=UPI0011A8E0A1|nr:helix-turn-helix transcriptional regulator [Bordetella genomosp. 13]
MPRKIRSSASLPPPVLHRLATWGRAVRAQRVNQGLSAADLCARMDISRGTLQRLERGDPGAAMGSYLTALWILGLLDQAAPALDAALWNTDPLSRVRHPSDSDDDDF